MLKDSRLTVQFARGSRPRDTFAAPDRTHPRPRRTAFRMQLTGLAEGTSWQVSYKPPSYWFLDLLSLFVGRSTLRDSMVDFYYTSFSTLRWIPEATVLLAQLH